MRHCWLVEIVVVLLLVSAASSVQAKVPSTRRIGCDSAATDSAINLLFGSNSSDRTIIDLSFPERRIQTRLIGIGYDQDYIVAKFDRWRVFTKDGDSLDIYLYGTKDIDDIIKPTIWGVPNLDYRASVVSYNNNIPTFLQTMSLHHQLFV